MTRLMPRVTLRFTPRWACLLVTLGFLGGTAPLARGADLTADPATFQGVLGTLQAGDRLLLAPGTYPHFTVRDLHGAAGSWIVIQGSDPATVRVEADLGPCCNTIEIVDSSYVALQDLVVDGLGVGGAFGVSAKGGEGNQVHHIRVEGCTFVHHDSGQQTVAISTKTPTWGWIIRRNHIQGAGTGLYLGNSNGADPFVAGIIEYNLVEDTVGYNMEIKWQQPWPGGAGLPAEPTRTVIRHNVFLKTDRPSPDGDRPNLLVGGFPDSGPGSENLYEIYGNLFVHNPRESLLQVSGRVSIHDNIFVDVPGTALRMQDHDLPLRMAHVYSNTVYAAGTGIRVGGTLDQGAAVVGNLIFADTPISGTAPDTRDNLTDAIAAASQFVSAPSTVLGQMDFYPLVGACQGSPIDLSSFSAETDFDRDFNGTPKGSVSFRGAYAGEGQNPGWPLSQGIPAEIGGPDASVGGDGGAVDAGASPDASGAPDAAAPRPDAGPGGDEAGGCGCHAAAPVESPILCALLLLCGLWVRARVLVLSVEHEPSGS